MFTLQPDPIAEGLVASLARPGGNVTGFTSVEPAMAGKWVELLKQVAPAIKRVAMLDDPTTPLEGGIGELAYCHPAMLTVFLQALSRTFPKPRQTTVRAERS